MASTVWQLWQDRASTDWTPVLRQLHATRAARLEQRTIRVRKGIEAVAMVAWFSLLTLAVAHLGATGVIPLSAGWLLWSGSFASLGERRLRCARSSDTAVTWLLHELGPRKLPAEALLCAPFVFAPNGLANWMTDHYDEAHIQAVLTLAADGFDGTVGELVDTVAALLAPAGQPV